MINDFVLQLDRFRKMTKEIMEEEYNQDDLLLGDIIMSLFERKSLEYHFSSTDDSSMLEEERKLIEFTDKVMAKDSVMEKIFNSLHVKKEDNSEELHFTSDTPGLMNFVMEKVESEKQDASDIFYRQRFELNSIIINMCITLESYVSKVIKTVYLDDLPSNFNGKQLTYEELQKIGDINLAKDFIIERYLDDLFRKNFNNWYNEVSQNLNIIKNDNLSTVIQDISELYQRRNLIVHTDGFVSNQYLQNVKNCSFKVGDKIDVDLNYLTKQLDNLEFLGWYIYDGFLKRKLKNINASFNELNSKILTRIAHKCDAIPELLNSYSLNKSNLFDEQARIIAKVNYLLYYKFNGGLLEYEKELSDFKVDHLKEDFRLAKKILSSDDDVIEHIDKFINSLDPDTFFNCLSWPIFRAVENKKEVISILNNRINEILEINNS